MAPLGASKCPFADSFRMEGPLLMPESKSLSEHLSSLQFPLPGDKHSKSGEKALTETIKGKTGDKIEEKIGGKMEKIGGQVEDKIGDKSEDKIENKHEEKVEDKLEEKVEEEVEDDKFEDKSFIETHVSNVFDGSDGSALLKQLIPTHSILGAGILLASLLSLLLPRVILLAVAAALTLPPLVRTVLREWSVIPNPEAADVRMGPMKDTIEGEFCVFLLGARCNAANKFTPDFAEVGNNFNKIIKQLERLPGSAGYLGGENFVSANMLRGSHVMTVTYWRSYDHMMRYTRDTKLAHTSAMRQLAKKMSSLPQIGLWHEAYIVKPGQHESLYINCPPLGLGAAAGLAPARGKHSRSK